jgi:WD40 repeat protein
VVIAASPDGKTALLRDEPRDGLELWSTVTGRKVGRLPPPARGRIVDRCTPVFSPDGRLLITVSEIDDHHYEMRVWDTGTAQPLGSPVSLEGPVLPLPAVSPDGDTVFLWWGIEGGKRVPDHARFWSVRAGKWLGRAFPFKDGRPTFSPDGRLLAAAGWHNDTDPVVVLRRVPSGEPFQQPLVHPALLHELEFSADSKLLLTRTDEGLRLWDVATGKTVGPGVARREYLSLGLAFSPNSRLFAAAGRADTRVFPVPVPVAADVGRIVTWVQVLTGQELDADGELHMLDHDAWHKRYRELNERWGGPPMP